jgi:hypothetical protein
MAEVLAMIKELRATKADKEKFNVLDKKVSDIAIKIDEILNMINFLQKLNSDMKPEQKMQMPQITPTFDNSLLD